MLKRNIINFISSIGTMLVLFSLPVFGQGQPPAAKRKTTPPRKQPRRTAAQKITPPLVQSAPVTAPVETAPAPETAILRKPGVLRIGIVAPLTPSKQMGSGADYSEMIRQTLAANLNSPMAESVLLEARVPVVAELEAKQKECDYILYSTVTHRLRTSDLAKFMSVAAPVVNLAAGTRMATSKTTTATPPPTEVSTPSTATPPAEKPAPINTETAVKALTDLSNRATVGDEVVFDFKLVAPGIEKPKLTKALKTKVRKDGDDVLSGLLLQAANDLLQTTIKK